jgi:hypothetical protein
LPTGGGRPAGGKLIETAPFRVALGCTCSRFAVLAPSDRYASLAYFFMLAELLDKLDHPLVKLINREKKDFFGTL